jgi:alditol oxidase
LVFQFVLCTVFFFCMARTNWAGNIAFTERVYLSPSSIEEIQSIVQSSSNVRARGSSHSFNLIANGSDVVVSLTNLPKIYCVDRDAMTVRINAGIRYGELVRLLHEDGFALSNLASLPHISVAGTIVTGTHGSGHLNQNLSAQVIEIELIEADGLLQSYSARSHPDIFPGMVVSLGALGIITALVLKIEPSFQVKQIVYDNLSRSSLRSHFFDIMSCAYSVSYFTSWARNDRGSLWVKDRDEYFQHSDDDFYGAKRACEKRHPLEGMDPSCCTDQLGELRPWHERLPHFKLEFTPSAGEELQSEYFVDTSHSVAALVALEGIADILAPVVFVTEVRTIAMDEMWLSGSYGRKTTAFHFTWKQIPEVYSVIPEIERILAPFDARPHWGKLFTIRPDLGTDLYPRWIDFCELRQRMDPLNKFSNEFTSQLFLDVNIVA